MTSSNSEANWNPPLSLEGVHLLSWPSNVFPEPFQNFVQELARSTETPVELSAMLTLAAVAGAAQRKYTIMVKEDYMEPLNLWTMVILPPASRKTRVYSEVTLPLKQWELGEKERLEPIIKSAASKHRTMEARLKELRAQAAKVDESKYHSIQKQIEALEKDLEAIPSCPQLWTGDITPEHLGTLMAANGEAMAIYSDEGGIFDIMNGLYSHGNANIDLFLQSHAGSWLRVDRGSRPPVFMTRPMLTMGLTIQPLVIQNACKNKNFRGKGLLGRFLYTMPPSNIGMRSLDEPPMHQITRQLYQSALRVIIEHPFSVGSNQVPHVLRLRPEAFAKWMEYAKLVESLMGDDIGHLTHITDWAGKLPGAIARIAGLIHVMTYAHDRPWDIDVSAATMEASVKIGHVLTNHALSVFDLLREDENRAMARKVWKWLKVDKITHFTNRDCLRRFRGLNKERLVFIFDILKEHEVIRDLEKQQHVGRPSERFEVNPHLIQ